MLEKYIMNVNQPLKYSIIIPAHNEENFIGKTLESVVQQTVLPHQLIVVNDNSTDQTEKIVKKFTEKHSFIQCIHSSSKSNQHLPGNKIVEAFYKGFEKLNPNWDIIVKLDADVILPKNYFEEILKIYSSHPKAGIVGGLALIEKNNQWVYENIGNKKQVRGPFKSYSRSCFESIGGLKKSIGWDVVDELISRFYGYEIKVLEELKVKLQKPTGIKYQKIHGVKVGESFYKMDYGFLISFIAATKFAWNKKNFKILIDIFKGYWENYRTKQPKIVTAEEGRFIRNYRWKGIKNKLLFK